MLRFEMKQKNNYSVVAFLDDEGKAELTGQDLLHLFNQDKDSFPMDYIDPFVGFTGQITAHVLGQRGIEQALDAYHTYKNMLSYPPGYELALVRAKNQTAPEAGCAVVVEQMSQ